MKTIISSEPFILALTVLSYYVGVVINDRVRRPFTNPLLIALVVIIPVIQILDIDYPTYEKGSHMVSFLLGPAVVALGYSLHKQIDNIKGNATAILGALIVGSAVGVVSVVGLCWLFDVPREIVVSLEPKSVTTPIAIGLSARAGGIEAITAIVVVVCGILGSVVGPWFLNIIGVRSKVARGLALGAASHGIGTSRAMQLGEVEGAVAGMAIGLMGVFTAIVMPLIDSVVH